jgi:hypothetical protein
MSTQPIEPNEVSGEKKQLAWVFGCLNQQITDDEFR